jgi:hypothetical protein
LLTGAGDHRPHPHRPFTGVPFLAGQAAFIGIGQRRADGPVYSIFEVL